MIWTDPLTSQGLERWKAHQEDLHKIRLLAEDAEDHLQRALELKGDHETLTSLMIGSQLLDYAGMKFLFVTELADHWQQLGAHPTRQQLGGTGGGGGGGGNALLGDLMETLADIQESYHAAWLEEYTPHDLRNALEKWDAEYQYWYRLQHRMRDFSRNYKEGDALPPFTSFDPGM